MNFRGKPHFGEQDLGVSPAGPMDRLAVISGNILLGNEDYHETLEILFPPKLLALRDFLFVLTGAHSECSLIEKGKRTVIEQGTVYFASKGAQLIFSHAHKGLRTTLSYRGISNRKESSRFIGRKRGDFYDVFSFFDRDSHIRIIKGPEFNFLINPISFTELAWIISTNSNEMGLRLMSDQTIQLKQKEIISDVVNDGTIQMTSGGPIVLMHHRQTTGGYPRIFNVISGDMDLLAQYQPGDHVRFKIISLDEAIEINKQKQRDIQSFRSRFL